MSQTLRRSLSFAGLLCVLVVPSRVTAESDHSVDCSIPRDFTVVVNDKERIIISKARLKVYLNERTVLITSNEATNSFGISANQVTLKFKGLMKTEYGVKGPAGGLFTTNTEKVSEHYDDRLSGVARRAIPDAELLAASDNCRFALLPTTDSGSPARSGYRLASEVRRLAEFCLQRKVCPKILLMGSKSGTTWLSGHFVGPSLLVNGNVENDNVHSCEIMQDTVNMMVDIGIDQLVRYLATGENPGTVALPDVTNQFPSDSISLVGGTFSDIRTLKRQSNVGISRSGKKLTLAMQISLEKLVIEYERYELHSIMSTDGLLTGSIAGASIAAQLSVNYEQQLCAVTLDSLKVTHLGTIKFEMTVLGVFNSLVRHLSTWLTGKFHNSVVSALESIIRQNIEDMLSSIDCETYRAWV